MPEQILDSLVVYVDFRYAFIKAIILLHYVVVPLIFLA